MDHYGGGGKKVAVSPEVALANDVFDQFCAASTFKSILGHHRHLCELLHIKPTNFPHFYPKLKAKLRSWKAQALWIKYDKRAAHKCYNRGKACPNTRVSFNLKKYIFQKNDKIILIYKFSDQKSMLQFCMASIRQLQFILLKVALIFGVEIHENLGFESLLPPSDDPSDERGWRAVVDPADHPVSQYEFDVLIGADGKRNTLEGFKRKEFRGKLAIAITANFINRKTEAEARVEEISGVAFIFNQKFFKELYAATGIDLENIVYYKDETHYFVMTAKKHSLLDKGVILNDYADTARLLSVENIDKAALMEYAREAADFSTGYKLPQLEFAVNHYGQPDVAMFDFTSMFAAENASRVLDKHGHRLLVTLVGDSLLEPFWPTGSGCARGFLSSMDACWAARGWGMGHNPLDVLAERESVYRILGQTTPENLHRDYAAYTLDPHTRYPNLNSRLVLPIHVRGLYSSDNPEAIEQWLKCPPALELPKKRRRKDSQVHPDTLLHWLKKQVALYDGVRIEDMTSSFKDGRALCAIIHRYRPDLIDFHSLRPTDAARNNQLAFDTLERELGISPVMTGLEMEQCEVPDKLAMLSYLSQLYDTFRGEIPHIKHPKLEEDEIPPKTKEEDTTAKLRSLTPAQRVSLLGRIVTPSASSHRKRHAAVTLPRTTDTPVNRRARKRRSAASDRADKPTLQQEEDEIPPKTKEEDTTAKLRSLTPAQRVSLLGRIVTPSASSHRKRHAAVTLPRTTDTPVNRRARKRRSAASDRADKPTLQQVKEDYEERQQVRDEIERNRKDRMMRRMYLRHLANQQFVKSMQMLQSNRRGSEDATPFEDYSLFVYRQTAPDFKDRVKELELKMNPFQAEREAKLLAEIKRGAPDQDFSGRIKNIEAKLKGGAISDKKPKDLLRAIGKIEKTDWNVREIEKKIEENKMGRGHKSRQEKVPKWSREQFDEKFSAVERKLRARSNDAGNHNKYSDIDKNLKRIEQKIRDGSVLEQGRNKVTAMAAQLAIKNQPEQEKPPLQKSNSKAALALVAQGGSEMCHFCNKRVYLMERLSAEGRFFHRGCFRCEYCSTTLRLGSYAFDRDGKFGSKFFCTYHFGLQGTQMMRASRKSEEHRRALGKENKPKTPETPKISKRDDVDLNRGETPERVEFENLSGGEELGEGERGGGRGVSEMDEDEWTDRNFGASAAEGSSDELSDLSESENDDDDAEADFAEALTADEKFRLEETFRLAENWTRRHRGDDSDDSRRNFSYQEFDSDDDDDSDTATEGEEDIRAREMRKKEFEHHAPNSPGTDSGSDTEVNKNKTDFRGSGDGDSDNNDNSETFTPRYQLNEVDSQIKNDGLFSKSKQAEKVVSRGKKNMENGSKWREVENGNDFNNGKNPITDSFEHSIDVLNHRLQNDMIIGTKSELSPEADKKYLDNKVKRDRFFNNEECRSEEKQNNLKNTRISPDDTVIVKSKVPVPPVRLKSPLARKSSNDQSVADCEVGSKPTPIRPERRLSIKRQLSNGSQSALATERIDKCVDDEPKSQPPKDPKEVSAKLQRQLTTILNDESKLEKLTNNKKLRNKKECSVASDEEYSESVSEEEDSEEEIEIENSATEIETDSEFEHDGSKQDVIIGDVPAKDIVQVKKGKLEEPMKVRVTTRPGTVVNGNGSKQLQKSPDIQLQLRPVVPEKENNIINNNFNHTPTPLVNPRKGDYLLNRTQSTEGIASKISLELKKRYLLGPTDLTGSVRKSGSASTLDSKLKNFVDHISEHQKLLNPAAEISPTMQAFLQGADKLKTSPTIGQTTQLFNSVKKEKELPRLADFGHVCSLKNNKEESSVDMKNNIIEESSSNNVEDVSEKEKILNSLNQKESLESPQILNEVDSRPRSPVHETSIVVPDFPRRSESKKNLEEDEDMESDSLSSEMTGSSSEEEEDDDEDVDGEELDKKSKSQSVVLPPKVEIHNSRGELMDDDGELVDQKVENDAHAADSVNVPDVVAVAAELDYNSEECDRSRQSDAPIDLVPKMNVDGESNNTFNSKIITVPSSINSEGQILKQVSTPAELFVSDEGTGEDKLSRKSSPSSPVSFQCDDSMAAALTETELSDWARDEDGVISETIDDMELNINPQSLQSITFRRNQRPRNRRTARGVAARIARTEDFDDDYTHVCGKADHNRVPIPTSTLLTNIDNIEFMDTGGEEDESSTEDSKNQAIKNSGYVQFVNSPDYEDELATPMAEALPPFSTASDLESFKDNNEDEESSRLTEDCATTSTSEVTTIVDMPADMRKNMALNTAAKNTDDSEPNNLLSPCIEPTSSTTYEDYVKRLQGRISPFSNVRDSIDIRKSRRNNRILDSNITMSKPHEEAIIEDTKTSNSTSVFKSPESAKLEEISRERSKQKDLIHDMVMNKLFAQGKSPQERRTKRNSRGSSSPSSVCQGSQGSITSVQNELRSIESLSLPVCPQAVNLNVNVPASVERPKSMAASSPEKSTPKFDDSLERRHSIHQTVPAKCYYPSDNDKTPVNDNETFFTPVTSFKSYKPRSLSVHCSFRVQQQQELDNTFKSKRDVMETPKSQHTEAYSLPDLRKALFDSGNMLKTPVLPMSKSGLLDSVRASARLKAKMKTDQELGLSPEDRIQALKERIRLMSRTESTEALSLSPENSSPSPTSPALVDQPTSLDTTPLANTKDSTSSRKKSKDRDRRKSIIQAVSDFFHKKSPSSASPGSPPTTSGSSNKFSKFRIHRKDKSKSANNSDYEDYCDGKQTSPVKSLSESEARRRLIDDPPPVPPPPLNYSLPTKQSEESCSETEDTTHAEDSARSQKPGRMSKRMARQAHLRRLRMAQEIQRQLEEVEVKQRELETQGVQIEKAIRGETSGYKLNGEKTAEEMAKEAQILQEMLQIVQRRDELLALLEEERHRYQEEDKDLEAQMLEKGLRLTSITNSK
ncbi:F-actin-monooxygenase Mical [Nilaparvata lugens]|uniref:F-actin-monooxygenase Mical n=1 Tax=Nilaparvata lugens TaxID=108931 RepID=UPI00193D2D18|nr:F-actin-monooxygenase Mical [Nilaparvata lugens]